MGLESPLKAEGPVGGSFCLSWMDGWMGGWVGATIIVARESRDVQYVFVQFVQYVFLQFVQFLQGAQNGWMKGTIVVSTLGKCICVIFVFQMESFLPPTFICVVKQAMSSIFSDLHPCSC